jgi:hypothetical protein
VVVVHLYVKALFRLVEEPAFLLKVVSNGQGHETEGERDVVVEQNPIVILIVKPVPVLVLKNFVFLVCRVKVKRL